jgi:hypothetical protein
MGHTQGSRSVLWQQMVSDILPLTGTRAIGPRCDSEVEQGSPISDEPKALSRLGFAACMINWPTSI